MIHTNSFFCGHYCLTRFWLGLLLVAGGLGPQALYGQVNPLTPKTNSPGTAVRPNFPFTTQEKFDASTIPAYRGNHPKVYAYIDAHLAEHLENLRRWVRQPSISAQNKGIKEMATLLRDDLKALGFQEAEVVPTSGHPGVWGYYNAKAKNTLVVYMMYDVQPIEPTGWQVEAFDGSLVDHDLGKVLMARGAINQKGPERTFLNAVEAIIKSGARLPVNLMVLAEGEEEQGSPHYPELIKRYADRLSKANGVLFPAGGQNTQGAVNISLGVKGITYFELEAQGNERGGPKKAEVHGSLKAITDSPVWRLTQALASLTTTDGNTILVPNYYDAIRPPTLEEQRLVNSSLQSWTNQELTMQKSLGVDRWIDGNTGKESLARLLFDTSLNIDGMWSGYTGPGTKTILPHIATAKVDSRLVPNQTPEEALRLIRRHLDQKGFTDIKIRDLGGYPPAQTSVESSLVRAAIGTYNKYDFTPSVSPRSPGSAPYYVFTEMLKLPMIASGIGHGAGAHAPNEYLVVEPKSGSKIAGLAQMEKFYVDLLFALAQVK